MSTNQAIELRADDVLVGTGKVTDVVRRIGWVRVTVQPEEGTPICFDLPQTLIVETDRPIPQSKEPEWKQPKRPNPPLRANPTPIPVPVSTAGAQGTAQPAEAAGGVSTAQKTPIPVPAVKPSAPSSLSGAETAASPATTAPVPLDRVKAEHDDITSDAPGFG